MDPKLRAGAGGRGLTAVRLILIFLLGAGAGVIGLSALWWVPPATDQGGAVEPADLVSDAYPEARAGDPGWDYHRTLQADLNGDGRPETVHVLGRIERVGPGMDEFAWDDGHPWNVYIEDEAGNRTDVFRGWVQLGTLRVWSLDRWVTGDRPGLLLMTEEGASIGLYRVDYDGPGRVTATSLARVGVEREAAPLW